MTVLDRLHALYELILSVSQRLTWLPPLLARMSVGLVFVSTGWGKLQNLDRVIEFFRSLGIPAPEYQAPFVAGTELSCGILLVLGLATRFAAVPLVVTMVVAIRTALWAELEGVLDLFGREECLFIVLLTWLVIAGPGVVSLDALFTRILRPSGAPRAATSAVTVPRREAVRP
jgi:putative oxidoreductase